jgi:hypothetical protein
MANAPQVCPLTASANPDVTALVADPGTIAETLDGQFFKKYSTGSTDWTRFSYDDEEYYKSRACGLLSCSRLATWKWDDFEGNIAARWTKSAGGGTLSNVANVPCGVFNIKCTRPTSGDTQLQYGWGKSLPHLESGSQIPSGSAGSWYFAARMNFALPGNACYQSCAMYDRNVTSIRFETSFTTNKWSWYADGPSATTINTNTVADTNTHVFEIFRVNAFSYFYLDGVQISSGNIYPLAPATMGFNVDVYSTSTQTTASINVDWVCVAVPTGHRMT